MSLDPWSEAGRREVTVAVVPCPVPGLYFPDRALIAIDAGSTLAVQRSAMAHELGHHELSHRAGAGATDIARQELRASRWAARRLVAIDDLAAAVRGAAGWDEVAAQLEVDRPTLDTRLAGLTGAERRRLRSAARDAGL